MWAQAGVGLGWVDDLRETMSNTAESWRAVTTTKNKIASLDDLGMSRARVRVEEEDRVKGAFPSTLRLLAEQHEDLTTDTCNNESSSPGQGQTASNQNRDSLRKTSTQRERSTFETTCSRCSTDCNTEMTFLSSFERKNRIKKQELLIS